MGCLRWFFILALGAAVGAGMGFAVEPEAGPLIGGIAGLLLAQLVMATMIRGPRFPGDRRGSH